MSSGVFRQNPRQVFGKTTTGDMRESMRSDRLHEFKQRFDIEVGWREQRFAQRAVAKGCIDISTGTLEYFSYQRITVRMGA